MEPSPLVQSIVATAERENMPGIRMMMERASEFPSTLQAQLTGIGLDPKAREFANRQIDAEFQSNRLNRSLTEASMGEIIIGSGFHAAVYAATRRLMGKPAPWIFERDDYVGGSFAIRSADGTYPAVFNLNSRNRRGTPGLSGDSEAQLNYLPGAPIQASALGNSEYQPNADIAFVIRLTLAQYARQRTFPGTEVTGVGRSTGQFEVTYNRNGFESTVLAERVIDARGLGDPTYADIANGNTVLTFPQFLRRMAGPWPLRGLRNVAVIGGGDSGKCVVESLFGLGPTPYMATAELDSVNRVDWYGTGLSTTYDDWCRTNRGRYRGIGRYLRPDRMGSQSLRVFDDIIAMPVALPGGPVLVNGRSYDLVIIAAGNRVREIPGMDWAYNEPVRVFRDDFNSRVVAQRNEEDYGEFMRYRIGPRASIGFDTDERNAGVSDISANKVAMFRLGTRTAALAVQLD